MHSAHAPVSIAAAREAQGLSPTQLAAQIGVSASFLGQLETGIRRPSAAVALRLWRALHKRVPLEVILGDAPEAPHAAEGT